MKHAELAKGSSSARREELLLLVDDGDAVDHLITAILVWSVLPKIHGRGVLSHLIQEGNMDDPSRKI